MKVGICTGGGDCPGLNAVIRACVRHGILHHGMEIIGIRDSFNGLMDRPYNIRRLSLGDVTDILHRGGTILGTTNAGNPFSIKDGHEKSQGVDQSQLVVDAYKDLGLDALIVVGGDGTQGIAYQLSQLGVHMVGVPKTIDNDLAATDQTVGFDTAVAIVCEAAERLFSTAESHQRVMVLEVMGRDAGHIALHAGVASGAHVVLLPEIPFSYDAIVKKLDQRAKQGKRFSVVICAEGAHASGSDQAYIDAEASNPRLGGIGAIVADRISQLMSVETRVTVLGHTQRGGMPSPTDRILGSAYGVKAIEMVAAKAFGNIVAYRGGSFHQVPYTEIAGKYRKVQPDDALLKTAEAVGVCLGR